MAIVGWTLLAALACGLAAGSDDEPHDQRVDLGGIVTYSGPLLDPISISEAGTMRHPIERDARTNGLKSAVVWLEGPRLGRDVGDSAKLEPAVMDQQNYEFIPHVLAVRAGQKVRFLNNDAANHGVAAFSLEEKNTFNVVTPAGGQHEHTFVWSRYPVAIGCPIHAAMSAWVYVFDHPHFAVTDERGRFHLPSIPPGEYTLHARHGDGGMSHKRAIVVRVAEPPGETRIEFSGADLKARR